MQHIAVKLTDQPTNQQTNFSTSIWNKKFRPYFLGRTADDHTKSFALARSGMKLYTVAHYLYCEWENLIGPFWPSEFVSFWPRQQSRRCVFVSTAPSPLLSAGWCNRWKRCRNVLWEGERSHWGDCCESIWRWQRWPANENRQEWMEWLFVSGPQ